MLTFAMALTIPTSELDTCMRLARPGYAAISLTNDLYSWRKEYEDAQKAGQDYVFNAVWVVMQERKCSEETAITICREEIKRHFTEFEKILQDRETKALSKDTQTYLEAVRLSHVGNLVWSIYCPRYQRGVYVFPFLLSAAAETNIPIASKYLYGRPRIGRHACSNPSSLLFSPHSAAFSTSANAYSSCISLRGWQCSTRFDSRS